MYIKNIILILKNSISVKEKIERLLKEEAIKMANAPETQVDVSLLNLIDFRNIKAEQVEPTIKNIKKVFDSAVENEVNKRLKETTPKTVISQNNGGAKKSIPNVF